MIHVRHHFVSARCAGICALITTIYIDTDQSAYDLLLPQREPSYRL